MRLWRFGSASAGWATPCTGGETLPDYQIAYVGKSALPEDTAHAIEAAFAQYGEDLNGDGIVSVKLNQYVSDTEDVENASTYALAAQMQFLSDMNAEESYFLLLDDPDAFSAGLSGTCQLGRHSAGRQRLYRRPERPCLGQTARCWPDTTLERIRPPCWEPPLLAAAQNW